MTSWQLHSGPCWSSTSTPWSMGQSLCVGSVRCWGRRGVGGTELCDPGVWELLLPKARII